MRVQSLGQARAEPFLPKGDTWLPEADNAECRATCTTACTAEDAGGAKEAI